MGEMLAGKVDIYMSILYLETRTTPLKHVINSRRLLYLQNILKGPQSEILRQVYEAQK